MKRVTINGMPYTARRLGDGPLRVGDLMRPEGSQGVYRVLCLDGADLIVRNVRHLQVVDWVPVAMARERYLVCEPL